MNVPTLSKCPGYNLYIGGFIALRRPQALKNANITHIVSVLDWKFEDNTPLLRGYHHLHIPVDDVEDENLLEWFPRSNAFIHAGLEYWKSSQTSGGQPMATAPLEDDRGSGVLIHCAMGKSRSATILLAYLLWSTRQHAAPETKPQPSSETPDMISLPSAPLTVAKALELLRQGRPIAEPNEGFMDQLHMYEAMGCPTNEADVKKHKLYRRWMNRRSVEESLRANMAPEMAAIIFEDEPDNNEADPDVGGQDDAKPAASSLDKETRSQGEIKGKNVVSVAPGVKAPDGTTSAATRSSPPSSPSESFSPPSSTSPDQVPVQQQLRSSARLPSPPQVTLKCRKCRHILATTPFLVTHVPPPHTDPAFQAQQQHDAESDPQTVGSPSSKCAHVFLHPLSWMRPVLAEGQMEGRLSCPKCSVNIGKFAWSGLRCSCGGWVTPGFGVTRGKVDEVVLRAGSGASSVAGGAGGGGALRLPPGMRRGGGNL